MTTPDDLLRQALGVDGYGVAGSLGTDRGMASANTAEFDLRTMTPNMLRQKYGDSVASSMMGTLQRGISDRAGDSHIRNTRSWGSAAYDTTTGVLAGGIGSLGNLAALGTGIVNESAGTTVAEKVRQGMEWAESTQSDSVNAARRLQRADTALDVRDNAKVMQDEIQRGTPGWAAEMRRWGRDVVDTVGNSITDPVMFSQGTAEATGSLVAGGPIAKGLRAIGAGTMALVGRTGLTSPAASTAYRTAASAGDDVAAARAVGDARGLIGAVGTDRISRFGSGSAWPLATAGLESGGAYTGSVSEVMEMSFEDLAKNSPMYQELVASGVTPAEARTQVANRTGLIAAAIQAPIAGATGTLTRFAETPTRAPSVGSAIGNVVLREPTEEAIQSTTGGLAQNYAIQQNADTTRTLSEGVGEQTAQGALYGMSSAGVLQGPGMAARGTYQGSKAALSAAVAAGGSITGAARSRARQIMAAEEQKSNIGTAAVSEAATQMKADLDQSMPELVDTINAAEAPQEQKDEAINFVQRVSTAMQVDPVAELEAQGIPAEYASVIPEGGNRIDAIFAAAQQIELSKDPVQQMIWANVMGQMMKPMEGIAETDVQLIDSLPEKQHNQMRAFRYVMKQIDDSPVIRDAKARLEEYAKSVEAISEEAIATPEGRGQATAVIVAAEQNPTEGNVEVMQAILDHASNGKFDLSPDARRSLNISMSLIEAINAAKQKSALYGNTPRDVVSEEVLTGNDPMYAETGHKSARQHINEIRAAAKGGNITMARGLMDNFGSFVGHMGRKVQALNEHFDTFGQKNRPSYIRYEAYNPTTGDKFPSDINKKASHKGMFVEPTNSDSVRLAQDVAAEAEVLANIFNGLVNAMPELNIRPIPVPALNPQLLGKSQDVSARFQANKNPPTAVEAAPDLTEAEYNASVLEAERLEDGVTVPDDAPEPAPVAPVVSRVSAEQAAKLSDAGLNDRLNALIDKRAEGTLTEQDTATFEVLDAEMTRREDAAATEARLEERRERNRVRNDEVARKAAEMATPAPVTEPVPEVSNKDWMLAKRTDLRPDDGRARFKVEDTTISYDRDSDSIKINLIATPKQARGKGSARKALTAFLALTDAAGVPVSLSVAEQDASTNRDALVSFYESFGFVAGEGDAMSRVVNGKPEPVKQEESALTQVTNNADLFDGTVASPWLMSDGSFVDTRGDHVEIFSDSDKSYADFMRRTGGIRAATFTDVDAGRVLMLHLVPEQKLTSDQLSKIEELLNENPGMQVRMGRSEKGNPEYSEPLTLTELKAEAASAPVVDTSTTAGRFPNLVTRGRNFFLDLFVTPKVASTRVRGKSNPISVLQDAIENGMESITNFGVKLRGLVPEDTIREYQDLFAYDARRFAAAKALKPGNATEDQFYALANVKGVVEVMQANLSNAKYGKEGSLADKFMSSDFVHRLANFKNLNIVEQNEDGTLQYNNELVELASLAAFQWSLTIGAAPPVRDSEAIESLTGIPEELQGNITYELAQGFTTNEIADSLVPIVKRYWDVRDPRDDRGNYADPAYLEGIPTAVAMEVVNAMLDIGLIRETRIEFTDLEGINREIPVFMPYVSERRDDLTAPKVGLSAYPTLIEELVMKTPEFNLHFDNERPQIPENKMNTQGVENTREDKAAIKAANETPYLLNKQNFDLFTQMGQPTIEELFGGGVVSDDMNVNHKKAVIGRNAGITGGLFAALDLQQQLTGVAGDRSIDEVSIHYAHNMSTVNRMQQLGGQTPQGNKLLREMVLPTTAVVNLSDERKAVLFDLAVAQALEIKIHRQQIEVSRDSLQDLLATTLAPAVVAMENWVKDPTTVVDHQTIADALRAAGKEVTPLAFHALKEVARFNLASAEERTKFKTALYIEADGVTNGVIMASLLMNAGSFTADQIEKLMKGGVSFGAAKSMADLYNGVDLYTEAATNAQVSMLNQIKMIRKQKNAKYVLATQNAALRLVADLLPGVSLSLDADGELVPKFDRSVSKNPMTVTLYGSSPNGIANKITSLLLEELYARASRGDISQEIRDSLTHLMGNRMGYSEEKGYYSVDSAVAPIKFNDLKTLTLNKAQLKQLQANIRTAVVGPLRQGIEDTLGEQMMSATTRLRKTMQVQSIFYEQLYKKRVDEAISERAANDPTYRKGDHLSKTALAKIREDLAAIAPWFKTANQTMLMNKFKYANTEYSYGQSMGGKFRPSAKILTPVNSGVAAIPYTNIGAGDGQTVQRAWSSGEPVVTRTLPVFDGVNASLNDIDELSQLMNKSVMDAGMTNPLQAAHESMSEFLNDPRIQEVMAELYESENTEVLSNLDFALGFPQATYAEMDSAQYLDAMRTVGNGLRRNALSAEARHRAMQQVQMSFDQFAAVGRPHVSDGRSVEGMDTVQIAEELNKEYLKQVEVLVAANKPRELEPEVAAAAVADQTFDVQILSPEAIRELAKGADLLPAQRDLLKAVLPAVESYSILAGTPDQLNAYLSSLGQAPIEFVREDGAVRNGIINTQLKQILLATDSTETMIHELVHAATFEVVQKHYNGERISKEATDAIQRLEALMEQFLGMRSVKSMTGEQVTALENAKLEIRRAQDNPNRTAAVNSAVALNEFMAWSTTNASLAERLSKIRANPVSTLIKSALNSIKSLLGLPKSDMLSNVVFNTAIIAQEQQSLSSMVAGITMEHASHGEDSTLIELRERLNQEILVHFDQYFEGEFVKEMLPYTEPMKLARAVSKDFGNVFNLTPLQESTLQMVAATMATTMALDTTALAQAQSMYQHMLANITVESFIDPTDKDPGSARYYAEQKYNLVTGKTGRRLDNREISSLLGSFVGMAIVSPEFKGILSKISVPTAVDNRDGTFDAAITYHARNQLTNLSRLISGQGKSKTVDGAVAALAVSILDTTVKEKGMVDAAQNRIDQFNDYVVGGISKLSDMGVRKSGELSKSSNKSVRLAGGVLGVVSNFATQEGADAQSETIIKAANRGEVAPTISRLISDFVGRTESNGNLYDLIKLLRSTIQQLRQHFRTDVPASLSAKFTNKPTKEQWTHMFNVFGKTDVVSLRGMGSKSDLLKYVSNAKFRANAIATLEGNIQKRDANNFSQYQSKMKQLANYMVKGVAGANLLSNAESIAHLFDVPRKKGWQQPTEEMIQDIDRLVTLYALDQQPKDAIDAMTAMIKSESEGLTTVLDYMASNRADELKNVQNTMARFNHIKGYLPSNSAVGKSLRIVDDAEGARMRELGYTNVGSYRGSQLDTYMKGKSYFFSNLGGKAAVAQGIMQNIHRTAGGVDPVTGFSTGLTAGRILSRAAVLQITSRINSDRGGAESLRPVRDQKGRVVAYERMVDPVLMQRLEQNTQLHEMLGVWRGRQVEEAMAQEANINTLGVIDKMYKDSVSKDPSSKKEFVNLMAYSTLDPVIRDMVDLFSHETKEHIKEKMKNELWVRRDMLEDVTGYRNASLGDFWTGNTRWSKQVQDTVRDLAISTFGIGAYKNLLRLEQIVQGLASDARTLIVVKSGLIPMLNFMSNVYHLLSVGVPIGDIVKKVPQKLVELRNYNQGMVRRIQIEVEIRTSRDNPVKLARLRAEMRSINDSFQRLSIWPLLQAGEFSTVADVGDQAENLQLSSGRVGQWLDNQITKLPDVMQTPAKIALVSKDTALFQGLQKSVQYGDFLAKAVLFDHHTRRKKMTPAQSLAQITDEFVNYDRLPGRARGALENFGLLWFYNFKLRMVKVAASTIRNRPVHALLTSMLPVFPGAEAPIGDSIISKLAEDSLGYSIGPEMGFRAPTLNPWWNLTQ